MPVNSLQDLPSSELRSFRVKREWPKVFFQHRDIEPLRRRCSK